MGVSEVHKDRCGHIANSGVWRWLWRYRNGLEILILPRREAPFYLSAPLWINTLYIGIALATITRGA